MEACRLPLHPAVPGKIIQKISMAFQRLASEGGCRALHEEAARKSIQQTAVFAGFLFTESGLKQAGRMFACRGKEAAVRRTVFWQRTVRNRTGSAEHGHAAEAKTVQQKPIGPADRIGQCFPQPGPPEVANCGAVSRSAGLSARPGAEG